MAELIPVGGTMELLGFVYRVAAHGKNHRGQLVEIPGECLGQTGKTGAVPEVIRPDGTVEQKPLPQIAPPPKPAKPRATRRPVATPPAPVAAPSAPLAPAPTPAPIQRPASINHQFGTAAATRPKAARQPRVARKSPPMARPERRSEVRPAPEPASGVNGVLLVAVLVLGLLCAGMYQQLSAGRNYQKTADIINGVR